MVQSLVEHKILPWLLERGETINKWILRNSKDSPEPYVTEDIKQRPCMKEVVERWSEIKEEVYRAKHLRTKIKGDKFFCEKIADDSWYKTYIYWYGNWDKDSKNFPIISEIVKKHKDLNLAMISVLKAGGKIGSHQGPWGGGIRVHMGIETPNSEDCFIEVDGERFHWKDNELVAFCELYHHHVENNTDKDRVVLFMDVERKMKNFWSQLFVKFINSTIVKVYAYGNPKK